MRARLALRTDAGYVDVSASREGAVSCSKPSPTKE